MQSCDFIRSLASRPTSSDLEVMREQIHADSLRRKALQDSLDREHERYLAFKADSIYVMTELNSMNCYIRNLTEQPKAVVSSLSARYWIVTGVFKVESHAVRLAASLKEEGYGVEVIPYGARFMVLAAPNDSLKGILNDYKRLSASSLSVPGMWIFDIAPVSFN